MEVSRRNSRRENSVQDRGSGSAQMNQARTGRVAGKRILVTGGVRASFLVAYGASKATVVHITRSVAMHCAERGYGIRCNSLHPGIVRTEMMNGIIDRVGRENNLGADQAGAMFEAKVPLGCPQEPEDIANAALFLLSDESRFITGTQLIVDGGMTLCN